jgi:membrane fusion protein (multidrug efflux system)
MRGKVKTIPTPKLVWLAAPFLLSGVLLATSCSDPTSAAKSSALPDVEVVEVQQKEIPLYSEWIGSLDGMVNAAVKAQVSGYLLKQDYEEGSLVHRGQLLFEIDPRPFAASLAQARGQLAQAEAQLPQAQAQLARSNADQVRTQLDVERYTPLVQHQAATQQDLDNAVQNNLAAKAQVQAATAAIATAKAQIQAAKAAVDTAQLNLEFTRITSPIDGIAGVAQQQVGNLVSPASGPVTTVSTLDPIKVYFTVGEQEYLALTRQFSSRLDSQPDLKRLQLELILADGTTYPRKGNFYFADREVNQGTGAIRMAGLFPNPGNVLRPGQYGRVRAVTSVKRDALLIPQRAVTELQGNYQAAVVGGDNTVSIRTLKVGQRVGNMWIVEEGLRDGERVVAEGVQKVRPGAKVNPKPFVMATGR